MTTKADLITWRVRIVGASEHLPMARAMAAINHEWWSVEDFVDELVEPGVLSKVAQDDITGNVIGYMLYESTRRYYRIVDMAVSETYRQRGVGSSLLLPLTEAIGGRRNRIEIEVRETNLIGQVFLRERGFRCVSILREFFDDEGTTEDAYLMEYRRW